MRYKKIIILMLAFMIFTAGITVYADGNVMRYFQDFSGTSVPSDSVFKSTSYGNLEGGTLKQKIQSGYGGFELTATEFTGNLYFSAEYTFVWDIELKIYVDDSSGDRQTMVYFATKDGKIYDGDSNVIGEIETQVVNKLRKIGIYFMDNIAFLYVDDVMISEVPLRLSDIAMLKSDWINDGASDYRPKTDNILLSEDSTDFPSLPDEYITPPELESTSPINEAEKVVIYNNIITLKFKDMINTDDIDKSNFTLKCNDELIEDYEMIPLDDGKTIEISVGSKLEPFSRYTLKIEEIESLYGVVMKEPVEIHFNTADGERICGDIVFTKTDIGVKAEASVLNDKAQNAQASIIICMCSGTEQNYFVTEWYEASKEIAPDTSEIIDVEITGPIQEGCFLKAFLWESSDALQPLRLSKVYSSALEDTAAEEATE